MTVGELIAELQKYPGDRLVLVDGYEGGLCVPRVAEGKCYATPDAPWYYGPYEPADGTYDEKKAKELGSPIEEYVGVHR